MTLEPACADCAAGEQAGLARSRPALHFAPRRNWMNDPNGLIQWRGRVHLFYQHNPAGPTQEHIAWGHASTADLWNWTDHPLALEPDPDGPDRDGCWSGCAVVHDGTPHLLYSGLRGQVTLPCLAVAADRDLIGWSRYERNPVIAKPPETEAVVAFRDHTAWRSGPAWYQVIGGSLADRGGALFLYRSADLRSWEYLGVFAAAADYGLAGQIWECPDVFTLGRAAVVIVSVLGGDPPYAMWMTGEITGGRFTPRASGRCDDGGRYYAPQSFPLADGRRVAIGWLRECLDELTGQDRSRVGAMSLPRELYLDGLALRSRPARELSTARREKLYGRLVEGRAALSLKLSALATSAVEVQVTPVRGEAAAIALRLCGVGCPDVEIEVTSGGVTIRAGGRPLTRRDPSPAAGRLPAPPAGQVTMYYDGGILEVYSAGASPAAVICDRRGTYDLIEAEILSLPGSCRCTASIAVWSCGQALGAA